MCLTNFSQHIVCLRRLRIDSFLFSLFYKRMQNFLFRFDILHIFDFEPKIITEIFLSEASCKARFKRRTSHVPN